jgi:hypothetical protein
MNPLINNSQMTIGDREFILVDVSKASGKIGIASYSANPNNPHERSHFTELFYVDDEALINFTRPPKGDEYTDKLVHQISTISAADSNIKTILSTVSDNYFTYSQSMTRALQPVFELLSDGIYVCHEAKMIPSDGAGNFFWSAYTMRHEVSGTASSSRTMSKDSNFTPCFLVPTVNPSEFAEAKAKAQREKLTSGKKVGGLAYYISGMFSALLDGHHSAAACLVNNVDFNCIIIEPLREVLYESQEEADEQGREPIVIALSCPYVKIPIGEIPPLMLENFLLRRNGIRPKHFSDLRKRANKYLRTVKKVIPRDVLQRAEHLPDCSTVESANAVKELTDEQLDALLTGEIKFNDEIIISNNYYNSVVTACNYLQYHDFKRFFNFAESIIKNPDLAATYKYIIDRLSAITDKRIYALFKELTEEANPVHEDFIPTFENYVRNYDKYIDDSKAAETQKAQKLNHAMGILGGEMSESNLAQMEAIARMSSRRG